MADKTKSTTEKSRSNQPEDSKQLHHGTQNAHSRNKQITLMELKHGTGRGLYINMQTKWK